MWPSGAAQGPSRAEHAWGTCWEGQQSCCRRKAVPLRPPATKPRGQQGQVFLGQTHGKVGLGRTSEVGKRRAHTSTGKHGSDALICFKSKTDHVMFFLPSVAPSCPTLCNPPDSSSPGLLVPHRLLEFAQVHAHCIGDAVQPSRPLTPSSPALHLSQHQRLFQ